MIEKAWASTRRADARLDPADVTQVETDRQNDDEVCVFGFEEPGHFAFSYVKRRQRG